MLRWLSGCSLFSLVLVAGAGLSHAGVLINEIHYDAVEKTVPEEFIELYNTGPDEADLSGWFFSSGIAYTFPEGTTLPAESWLVVAEDPDTLAESFGLLDALGPFEGRLSSDGERVVLRDATGILVDEVDFQARFPWPMNSTGRGSSMELIHPSLDNNLGGSWRASGMIERPFRERLFLLERNSSSWRYRKGLSEASDPVDAWRQQDFVEDDTWLDGQTSIGFGDDDDATVLEDMEDNYTSVYLRHTFEVAEMPPALKLGSFYDDGIIVWINGVEVARLTVDEGEIPFDGRARGSHEARWQEHELPNPALYLVEGQNTIAIHGLNLRVTSGDFSVDCEVFVPGTIDEDQSGILPPSPGAQNTVWQTTAPPQIRQVVHTPQAPTSETPISVSARVTDPDGVQAVELAYQTVLPGEYIPAFLPLPHALLIGRPLDPAEPNPEFEDPANWNVISMRDDGIAPDLVANDGNWTVEIPAQEHRTLVRYRVAASDTAGLAVRVPYEDDRSLNFACFVYDGVPDYVAAGRSVHPEGAGHVYPSELMTSLPVYHLLTRPEDMTHCVSYSGSTQIPKSNERARDRFNWEGTFVYEGIVYDHVRYRLRQANDRYGGSGKRSMRIRFNKGDYLRARDNWGRRYPTRWRTLNTGKMFDNKRVGNFGLTETMNARLWNMVGLPAPHFNTFHFRVIDGAEEAPEGAAGQHNGDFWGMFNGIEDYDPRFLDAHGLEDGNLYKLKDGQFNGLDLRRNQGRFAVTTDADFQNIRRNLRPSRDAEWLNAHVNYPRWYRYHAVVEGIRHYDFRPADSHSKNRAWYFEPDYSGTEFGRLWTLPWDSDASWGPNWNSGIDYTKDAIFGGGGKPVFKQAYRNYLREFRDLVWTEEVIEGMIDELAAFVEEFSSADRDRWRGGGAAGNQDFGPIRNKIIDMKRFAFVGWSGSTGPTVPQGGRARHLDNLAAAEGDRTNIPVTPVVTPATPESFPLDALLFDVSDFEDPQGDAFAGISWRIGEVHEPMAPGFDPLAPRVWEATPVWESPVLETFASRMQVPPTALRVGHRYRVRARVFDEAGKASHWSEPVEFLVTEPGAPIDVAGALRISEIHYHPADDDLEFIEVINTGASPIDLTDVRFRDGIDFEFVGSDVTSLAPGAYAVVVKNLPVFERHYDTEGLAIAGEFTGRLANDGERIELRYGEGVEIIGLTYSDLWHPTTDGQGFSLVAVDPADSVEALEQADGWRPSAVFGGSPGRVDEIPEAGLQLPGNINQDARIDLTDAVQLFARLFQGEASALPCGDGSLEDIANAFLVDINQDQDFNLTDGIHLLQYLFQQGAPPAAGTNCLPIDGCPEVCP